MEHRNADSAQEERLVVREGRAEEAPTASLDAAILRAYDVRGVVGAGLNADVVRLLGQAIGSEAADHGQQEIVVARDGRLTSEELAIALIEGLQAAGRDVVDIGRVPTPLMNFATFHLQTGAGVMVTGSHNPPEYNGLKIVVGGRTLSGEAIQALGKRVEQGRFVAGEGGYRRLDILQDYIERVVGEITLARPLRIVVDAGNGVAGSVAPAVFRALGCEVEELYCEVDGRFPNHHPDPTVPGNLIGLIDRVRTLEADVGLAFDGDGDRLGVVDGEGRIIWADRQMMLFARDVLMCHPGADIVFDAKCSADLTQLILDHAGVPVMWKTGHSMIKNKVHEINAPLGGELSGHIFFNDRWYGFDDAVYAGARLLEILALDPREPAAVFAELPDALSTPEIRVDLAEGEPERIMATLLADPGALFEQAHYTLVDGIRADFADGWGLVRASNTTPSLVLRFEARDEAGMARIKGMFRKRLLERFPELSLPF
ncbi:phosphomannomutase/phosphoglucomutase [Alkalilimnicola ehrlichii]|uniref:phosphomannomutase n=2 Tax=Alkalilimnicola ehrlichii TaxID=351052 RepID=A0A3E0WWY4_9GAMM|nr:phosphomannomutase/phosphoglucomutase [Alkalilimnicola ehrlichii]RFA37520.1 phosphomannomutase/phosphoglucomutase [Alkalilimnicola ehrlichii]